MGRKIRRLAAWLVMLALAVAVITGCAAQMSVDGGNGAGQLESTAQEAAADAEAGGAGLDGAAGSVDERKGLGVSSEDERKSYGVGSEDDGQDESQQGEKRQGGSPADGGQGNDIREDDGGIESEISEDGEYSSRDEVALYLHTYGRLPGNYITKREAQALGWDSKAGNLQEAAPGKSIGGNRFGNYEGQLPEKEGRKYYECDVEYEGGYRGAKRLIYSNDGLIFYTEDHYKTFEQLY